MIVTHVFSNLAAKRWARLANGCIASALVWSAVASAQVAPSSSDEVRVRGGAIGGFSSRVTLEESPRTITDVASLLEPLPGVHVRRLGADDGFATLSIRGSSSNQVTVLIAGVPLTGGADPSLDLATLPIWPGVQMKVYRSFAPASVGPGSLGGTLELGLPALPSRSKTEAWMATGSFGENRVRVGVDYPIAKGAQGGVLAAVSASRATDRFSYLDPLASSPGRDVYTLRENADVASVNGLVAYRRPVRWGPSSDGMFTITTLLQAREQGIAGSVVAPTPRARLESNRELLALELTGSTASSGVWTVRGWGRRDQLQVSNPLAKGASILGPTRSEDIVVAAGGAFGWRQQCAEKVTLDARLDASRERYSPGPWLGVTQPVGAHRTAIGLGADAAWRATNAWTFQASARADAWRDQMDESTGLGTFRVRPTGHLGVEWRRGALTLATHGGRLARPPGFFELFGNRGATLGNSDLRPESAWTVDAGGKWTAQWGPARIRAEWSTFITWSEDLIAFVFVGARTAARSINIGQARLGGIESEVEVNVKGIQAKASYTWLTTANVAACAAQRGPFSAASQCEPPPLPGRPEHDLVVDLSYGLGPFRVRYGVDVVSGMVADLAGAIIVPTRVLQSAGATAEIPWIRGLRAAIDIRNLFDVRVATYEGVAGPAREPIGDIYEYPLPGRRWMISLRWVHE